jgi:Protein of unknown function (DUF3185)
MINRSEKGKPMNKMLGLVLLAAGVILLGYGINANHSLASGLSRAVTGQPTDRAMWLMVAGGIITALGVGSLLMRSRD